VTVTKSPHPSVVIEKAGSEKTASLFTARLSPLQRCSFFLLNNSDKDVVGVDANWTVIDDKGNATVWRFTSDSFLDVRDRPVIEPHSRILVGPRIWVKEDSIQQFVNSGALTAKSAALGRLADRIAAANAVYVDVDSIIFADGEVAGPNTDEFDREITIRRLAANDVLAVVRDAKLAGRPPTEGLHDFVAHSRSATDRTRALWQKRFARQLEDLQRFEGNLYYLEHLPAPPDFYRTYRQPDLIR
jgi:hypothetical protein